MSEPGATLYGIANCDQVRKARAWLNDHGVAHGFHDFKKAGVSADQLQAWIASVGWERLVNRQGTTWRALPDERKASITDARQAALLMREATSIIKRPVLQIAGHVLVGFDPAGYRALLAPSDIPPA